MTVLTTQSNKHTAQVLYDLLEGEKQCEHATNIKYDCKNCNAYKNPYGADSNYNRAIEYAQALIRQTLDPISNQE